MSDNKAPCKDCLDRYINCHSECDKYINYKTEHDNYKEEIRNKKSLDNQYYNYAASEASKRHIRNFRKGLDKKGNRR